MGEHSAENAITKTLLQPVSVSRAQLGRTVLQQNQAMPACCDPIRQTRGQLPGHRQSRIKPRLVAEC